VTSNMAASVHQRLLNRARTEDRPFSELLHYFALERFLYRLGCSPYRERFVLKGALMFTAWRIQFPRSTRDIDLLGFLDNTVEHIVTAIREICQQPVTEDGLRFATESVVGEQIIEAADYEGVRVRFVAYLGTAHIPMQIDVGFGDAVVPAPTVARLPTMLDFPPPEVWGYTRESVIAEKLQSMVRLGEINSRMKDFFDIWLLASHFSFEGPTLAQAIRETFSRRQTPLTAFPVAFDDTFAGNPGKQIQWQAFLRRYGLGEDPAIPATLPQVVESIAAFLRPILKVLVMEQDFDAYWHPGGPWFTPEQGLLKGEF
jgi:hypothetical protein